MNRKIKRFAQQMQIELDNNKHKGEIFNWKGIVEKISELEYHKSKMMLAIRMGDKDSIKEYIADCGNTLMSIGDELGLYEQESKNTGIASELKKDLFNHVPINTNKVGNFLENINIV